MSVSRRFSDAAALLYIQDYEWARRVLSCRAAAVMFEFLILDYDVYILYLIYCAFMVKY